MSQRRKPLYRETAHDYPFLAWALVFATLIPLLVALSIYALHPQGGAWPLFIGIPTFFILSTTAIYFLAFPITIEIGKNFLILRRSRVGSLRDRFISIIHIRALRRISYQKKLHSAKDVQGAADLERWNFGGDRVLEIELENGKRIQIASPRSDQLTALLHEMTHIPVEDCR